jgi:hypothetical protein
MPREIRHRNCVFLLCMQKRSFSVTCRFAPQTGGTYRKSDFPGCISLVRPVPFVSGGLRPRRANPDCWPHAFNEASCHHHRCRCRTCRLPLSARMVEGGRKRIGPQRGDLLRQDVRGYCPIRVRFSLHNVIVRSGPACRSQSAVINMPATSLIILPGKLPENGICGNSPCLACRPAGRCRLGSGQVSRCTQIPE